MLRQPSFLFLLATLALGCGQMESPLGIQLKTTHVAVGEVVSGEIPTLAFPFEVHGVEVVMEKVEASCGCLNPRLLVNGDIRPWGATLAPGTRGTIQVDWDTAGIQGEKNSSVQVFGTGPGMPLSLTISGQVTPWFQLLPRTLRVGQLTGDEPAEFLISVTAPEPFRILNLAGPPQSIRVHGLPSASAATRQTFRVVIQPAGTEEGTHREFLRLQTDGPYPMVLPVAWDRAADFWVQPGKLLLGVLEPGMVAQTTVDFGARVGELSNPKVWIEGISDATADCVTLGGKSHYRIRLGLPKNLESGPISGFLHIHVTWTLKGVARKVEKEVRIFGLVRKHS